MKKFKLTVMFTLDPSDNFVKLFNSETEALIYADKHYPEEDIDIEEVIENEWMRILWMYW